MVAPMPGPRHSRRRRGVAALEFAFVAPLVILFLFALIVGSTGVSSYQEVAHLAREGARYGATNHCDTIGIKNQAKLMAAGLGDSMDVKDPVKYFTPEGRADRIKVIVEYNFETVTPMVGVFLGEDGAIKLMSEARQLIELQMICP